MIKMTCPSCGHSGRYRTPALAEFHFGRHSCTTQNERMARRRRQIARAQSSGTSRDCDHKNARHEHGTRLAYILDKCRCRPCRDAAAAYERDRVRNQLYGRPGNLVDAQPAREHLQHLLAAGMGLKTISAVGRIGHGSLYPILWDRGGSNPRERRPRRTRITRDLEQRILAIQPQLADGARIDATGTRRRIRALIAIGWTQTAIAARLGWTVQNLSARMVQGTRGTEVTERTRKAVVTMYDDLWQQPQTGGHATRARALAARHGWPPPLAWDDDAIDDPTASPAVEPGERVTLADRVIDLLDIAPDTTWHGALHRLRCGETTLEQSLIRAHRTDITRRLKGTQRRSEAA